MKKYTHPYLNYTSIHQKDGSCQSKYWNYLRGSIVLETSGKKEVNFVVSSSNYKRYFIDEKSSQIVISSNPTKDLFWNK